MLHMTLFSQFKIMTFIFLISSLLWAELTCLILPCSIFFTHGRAQEGKVKQVTQRARIYDFTIKIRKSIPEHKEGNAKDSDLKTLKTMK